VKRRVYQFAPVGLISVLLIGTVCTVRSAERAPIHQKELPVGIEQQYAKLPMSFEPNKGQFDSGFAFGSRGRGYALFLKPASATLMLRTVSESKPSTLTLRFLKSNERAELRGAQRLPGVANYFRGPSKYWITDVPTYEKVRAADIYPGIDVVYYGNQNHFEYDLLVKPGASAERIDIAFEGASDLTLTEDGDLVIALGEQRIQQPRPVIYQETNGRRAYVSGHYILRGKDRVGFQIGQYDHSKPLVIDPQLVYSVFGFIDTLVEAIGVDSAGNAYITGAADDPLDNNRTDVYAAKINAAGTAFVWTNFFGSRAR
jgi:hypothetical protein